MLEQETKGKFSKGKSLLLALGGQGQGSRPGCGPQLHRCLITPLRKSHGTQFICLSKVTPRRWRQQGTDGWPEGESVPSQTPLVLHLCGVCTPATWPCSGAGLGVIRSGFLPCLTLCIWVSPFAQGRGRHCRRTCFLRLQLHGERQPGNAGAGTQQVLNKVGTRESTVKGA